MSEKQRLSASVDAELVEAARVAVARGEAASVSAWVNEALRRQLEHNVRMRALGEAIAAFEAEHGEITEQEMADAERWARENAIIVRGTSRGAA